MRTLAITSPEELRQADHKAVIAWERYMRESEHAASSTIRRRLAVLSSFYKHLVRHARREEPGRRGRAAGDLHQNRGMTRCVSCARADGTTRRRSTRRPRRDYLDAAGHGGSR
jgi:integrase/recombinase XerD